MRSNIYYLDVDYKLAAYGKIPERTVCRPGVAMLVESDVEENNLRGRKYWWGDTYPHGRFASAPVNSREDILMSMGNVDV